jgi:hypothetical protein
VSVEVADPPEEGARLRMVMKRTDSSFERISSWQSGPRDWGDIAAGGLSDLVAHHTVLCFAVTRGA